MNDKPMLITIQSGDKAWHIAMAHNNWMDADGLRYLIAMATKFVVTNEEPSKFHQDVITKLGQEAREIHGAKPDDPPEWSEVKQCFIITLRHCLAELES